MYGFNYCQQTYFTPVSHVFETGISDHHLMVYTMLKSTYTKLEPKTLRKRSYKDFNKESFLWGFQHGLNNIHNFAEFHDAFKVILDHHATIKQTKLHGNTKPHINKTLRKEIMKRSRLKIELINQVKKMIKGSITFNEIKSVN